MARLQDKIVLITGAAGAVGRAVASAIKREGGQAVTTDLAGQAGIDHVLDVTAEDGWQSVLAAVDRRYGRLDGLVNSAGTVHLGTVEDTDYATWRRVLAINLDGTFLGCKHALPLLKRSGGAIVNLSSISGIVGGHKPAGRMSPVDSSRVTSRSGASVSRPRWPSFAFISFPTNPASSPAPSSPSTAG